MAAVAAKCEGAADYDAADKAKCAAVACLVDKTTCEAVTLSAADKKCTYTAAAAGTAAVPKCKFTAATTKLKCKFTAAADKCVYVPQWVQCEASECCGQTNCFNAFGMPLFTCPENRPINKRLQACAGKTCTVDECCGPDTTVKQCTSSIDCKEGTSPLENLGKKCAGAECTADECCTAEKDLTCAKTGKNCKGATATIEIYGEKTCKGDGLKESYVLDGTCQTVKNALYCADLVPNQCGQGKHLCLQWKDNFAQGGVDKCTDGAVATFVIYLDDKCTKPVPLFETLAMSAGKPVAFTESLPAAGECGADGDGGFAKLTKCEVIATEGTTEGPKAGPKQDTLEAAAVPRAPSLLLVAATMAAAGMHAFM